MFFLKKAEGPTVLIKKGIPAGFEQYRIHEAKRFYYEEENHTTFSQCIRLIGCTMWWHVINASQQEEISATATKSGLRLNFTLGTMNADAALNKHEPVKLMAGKADMFYVPKGSHDATLPAGIHTFFHVDIDLTLLMLLQEHKKFRSLMRALKFTQQKGSGHINSRPVPVNVYCASLIEDIRQHTYEGAAAKVYLSKKIWLLLQYFAQYFTRFPEQPARTLLTPLDINNTDKAKAYIKQHMSEQLSLRTLGKALRINNTQLLAQHFKQLNDISLYEFDRYYRMEAAFQRVTQTRFSIAFIAHIFGYKRTTAFSKAFGKYFGYSPSTLRKGKKGSR